MLVFLATLLFCWFATHTALPLCNLTSVFQGKWHLVHNSKHQRQFCHKPTGDMVVLRQDRYLCAEYKPAVFTPSSCLLYSISDALHIIQKLPNPTITFVGDSLAGQQFIAASCLLQERKLDISVKYFSDFFLENVTRCTSQCLLNATYRAQFSGEYFNPCYSCPNGVVEDSGASTPAWISSIPSQTNVLILNSGAWYNAAQGIDESNHAYDRMLRHIAPILRSYVRQGMLVLWITLPPAYISNSTHEGYHWHYFTRKNELVASILHNTGVLVLDPTPATIERKINDYHVSHDAVHWCLAGRKSIPAFINKVIFHTIAAHIDEISAK